MTPRTRTAKTAETAPAPAPAKKAAAKKATARKANPAGPRPARTRNTGKNGAAKLSLVKTDTPPPAKKTATTRAAAKKSTAWPDFITHKAITAHYQARLHGLPTRNIRDWHETRGIAVITFPTGARIDHTPTGDAPFYAHTPCKNGGVHYDPVRSLRDLRNAEQAATSCTDRHGAPAALALGAGLKRAKDVVAETQPIPTLPARAADTETAKEHPQP